MTVFVTRLRQSLLTERHHLDAVERSRKNEQTLVIGRLDA